MSYFTVICPWCGATYTAGIVGRTPVGSGHTCEAEVECSYDDCTAPGIVAGDDDTGGDPIFRCFDHVDGLRVGMVQNRKGDE